MRHSRLILLTPLALLGATLSACEADSTAARNEGTASSSAPLLGAFSVSGCSANQMTLLMKARLAGRFLSMTDHFKSCVTSGAYRSCSQDDNKDPAALLPITLSTNDTWMKCADLGAPDPQGNLTGGDTDWGDMHGYGYAGTEVFNINTWWLQANHADSPSPTPTDVIEVTKIIWHEAMHVHGYKHGSDGPDSAAQQCGYADGSVWNWQGNSAPYLVEHCLELQEAFNAVLEEFLSIGQVPSAAQQAALWAKIEGTPSYTPSDLWNDVHTVTLDTGVAGSSSAGSGAHPVYRIFVPTSDPLELTLTGLPAGTTGESITVFAPSSSGPPQSYGGSVLSPDPSSYGLVLPSLAPGWYLVAINGSITSYTFEAKRYVPPPAPPGCTFGTIECGFVPSCQSTGAVDVQVLSNGQWVDASSAGCPLPGTMQLVPYVGDLDTVTLRACTPGNAASQGVPVCDAATSVTIDWPPACCQAPSSSSGGSGGSGSGGGSGGTGSGGKGSCGGKPCLI